MTSPVVYAFGANPDDHPSPPDGYKWSAIDRTPSAEFPYGFITYHFDDPPAYNVPEPAPEPNWAQFRLGMLANPGFLRVVAYGMSIFQASLATEINQNPPNEPNVGAIALIWNQIMAGLPQGAEPTEAEIEGWNAIATSANIPLTFNSDGSL